MMRILNLYLCLLAILLCYLLIPWLVHARDLGQWGNEDPELRKWFSHLMMPDHPQVSCCGEADSYWCDEVHTSTGQPEDEGTPKGATYCRITDDRDDDARKRTHIPMGTLIQIPDRKFNHDGNPTGHVIVFLAWYNQTLSDGTRYSVYCFILNGGV